MLVGDDRFEAEIVTIRKVAESHPQRAIAHALILVARQIRLVQRELLELRYERLREL